MFALGFCAGILFVFAVVALLCVLRGPPSSDGFQAILDAMLAATRPATLDDAPHLRDEPDDSEREDRHMCEGESTDALGSAFGTNVG